MTHYVYVAQGINLPIKIGMSANPERRVEALIGIHAQYLRLIRTWQFPNADIAYKVEQGAHVVLQPYNDGSEWFNVTAAEAVRAVRHARKMLQIGTPVWAVKGPLKRIGNCARRNKIADETHAETKRRADLIRDDWPKPSSEHKTSDLLMRAGPRPGVPMAPSIARRELGRRPDRQRAYQIEINREAGRAAARARKKETHDAN